MSASFDAFMVYTTMVGGLMKVCWATREVYEEAKRTGRLNVEPCADVPEWVDLKMVAFATVDDLHDFVLDRALRRRAANHS